MKSHVSKEADVIFDITGKIKQATLEITEALQQGDEELVEDLFEDLIALINSHENKYEAAAYTIIDSRNLTEEYRAKAKAYNDLAKRLKERLQDRMNQQGLRELDAGIFTLRIQRNGQPTVIVELPIRHRVYVHINNTNPMLNDSSPERRRVDAAGVRVGADGDVFDL